MTSRKTKRRLIPYAGFDPSEDRMTLSTRQINKVRAHELRASGMKWMDICRTLAEESGRPTLYATDSVMAAVGRYRKELENDGERSERRSVPDGRVDWSGERDAGSRDVGHGTGGGAAEHRRGDV
jgi:hypothetical protein